MKSKYANPNIFRKIYIYLYTKYCKLFHKKLLKKYIAVFKYKDKVGYYINVIGFNRKDCIEKVRMVVFHSNFFNGLKNKKDIQVIVIENERDDYE